MKLAIHQPNFLPWLGFFDKMVKSDIFVILDDVQVSSDGTATRNKIRVPNGWSWVSVPIDNKKAKMNVAKPLITEHWVKETRKKIDRSYPSKKVDVNAVAFKYVLYGDLLEPPSLSEFNLRLIKHIMKLAGITTTIFKSSSLGINAEGSDRILNICEALGADCYLSGHGGKNYLKESDFEKAGIALEYQDFTHPTYPQMFPGWEPNMSAIDKLFCTGRIP